MSTAPISARQYTVELDVPDVHPDARLTWTMNAVASFDFGKKLHEDHANSLVRIFNETRELIGTYRNGRFYRGM